MLVSRAQGTKTIGGLVRPVHVFLNLLDALVHFKVTVVDLSDKLMEQCL